MSNYGWTNEAGEPIMDGAAWRFEQALDAQSAEERAWEDFADEGDYEECESCTDGVIDPSDGRCFDCGRDSEGNLPDHWGVDPIEDAWLDGSYEE